MVVCMAFFMKPDKPQDTGNTKKAALLPDDHLKWRYQDASFNEEFKRWRKENKSDVGYYYVDKPKELTYQDRVGFIKDYPEAVETSSLRHVYNMIGISLLIFSIVDILYFYIAPFILGKLGFDISYDFYSNTTYGNEWLRVIMLYVWGIGRRIMPFYICKKRFNMPFSIMFPTKVTNKPMFKYSVPLMMLVCNVCSMCAAFYMLFLKSLNISSPDGFYLPENKGALAAALVAQLIIIPIISEMAAHGVYLQLFRQFGDGSAIILTAIIASLVTYNITDFCYFFVASIVIGYFTIRTGSIITSIIMRITLHLFLYGGALISTFCTTTVGLILSLSITLLSTLIGIIASIHFLIKHSDSFGMTMSKRYLTFSQKCTTAFTCIPVVLWITITFIITLLNINFSF